MAIFSMRSYSWKIAGKPGFIMIRASRITSQLVIRMQPWLSVLPMVDGSGVPWMP